MMQGVLQGFLRGSKFQKSWSLKPLMSKKGNRNFYKGKGCRNEGRHTSKGRYVMNVKKMLDIQCPDLAGFEVRKT